MSDEIAAALEALDEFDVTYELTPMDTVVEADSIGELFDATKAAHDAVDGERVITSLEVDDQRDREQHRSDRVETVERRLG